MVLVVENMRMKVAIGKGLAYFYILGVVLVVAAQGQCQETKSGQIYQVPSLLIMPLLHCSLVSTKFPG